MLKVQKRDNKQNQIINDTYSFGLRTYELRYIYIYNQMCIHLQLLLKLLHIEDIFVQLQLFITTFAISVIINLGYLTFTQLDIRSVSKILLVKTRINVSD